MPPPAIIDTNVVIAGLLTARDDSPVVRILDGMVAAGFAFVLSDALLAEYHTVMMRPKLRAAHGLDDAQIDTVLLELAQHAMILKPGRCVHCAPDPGDQRLWDLLYARDDLILVSGDLRLRNDARLRQRIVSPQGFLDASGSTWG